MKKTIVTSVFALLCFSLIAQWDSPGDRRTTHGSTDYPQILGFGGALLELQESNQSPAGAANGLVFTVQNNNGIGSIIDAYLHYHTNFNQLMFSKTGNTNDKVFSIDADNGNMEIEGFINLKDGVDITAGAVGIDFNDDEVLWYNEDYFSWGFGGNWNRFAKPITIGDATETPANTAILTTDGDEIKMLGDNSYIQFYTSTSNDPTGSNSGFIGSNQFGSTFVESNLGSVIIDGETGIDFYISDSFVAMSMDDMGNVGVGTLTPAYKFQVAGDADISGELTAASDLRLKKNIKNISSAISKIMDLSPKTYNFRTDEFEELSLAEGDRMGFIAQEVEKVLPALVKTGGEVRDNLGNSFKSKSVNYIEIIPLLTKAIQEQQELINQQNNELAAYRSELNELRGMVSEIRSAMDHDNKKSVRILESEK